MPPLVLVEAVQTLRVTLEKSFFLNLGNDRPVEHHLEVHMMAAGKQDHEALAFLPAKVKSTAAVFDQGNGFLQRHSRPDEGLALAALEAPTGTAL